MRTFVLTLALSLVAAPAALTQAPAAAPPAAPEVKYTLDTPIHELMENPVTLAWLDRHFPGMSERMRDPEVGTIFAGVSIEGLSIDPDHGRALTPEVMARLKVSLEKALAEGAAAR